MPSISLTQASSVTQASENCLGYRQSTPRGIASATALAERLMRHNWDFPDSRGSGDIHAIHPYPAKFIPEIPRSLISDIGVPSGTAVLDPFCGSGTTLVEAQSLGHPSIGIDLNPIACLIARAKTSPLPFGFAETAKRIVQRARNASVQALPSIPNLNHWFQRDVQECLAALSQEIASMSAMPAIQDCLRLALSAIIVRVSNQDSDTSYAAVKKSVDREKVFEFYTAACLRLAAATASLPFRCPDARVIQSDIMDVTPQMIDARVGLMITSPPYPNAYEYWLYHKYRMWWLGYDPIAVRQREIGARAHYFRSKNIPTIDDFRRQMRYVLSLAKDVLVPRGHICVIVGRSRIHGKDIDNASLIAEIAKELGYSAVARIERTIAAARKSFNLSHARIKTEELIVLGK